MLLARLLAERPEDVPALHRRASRLVRAGRTPRPAVRHAFAAGDVDLAADLIEVAAPDLRRHRAEGTLRSWLSQLPADVLAQRPVLANDFIGALMASGSFDGVEPGSTRREASLDAAPDDDRHPEPRPSGAGCRRCWRRTGQGWPWSAGDHDATITHAETALARAPADDQLDRWCRLLP